MPLGNAVGLSAHRRRTSEQHPPYALRTCRLTIHLFDTAASNMIHQPEQIKKPVSMGYGANNSMPNSTRSLILLLDNWSYLGLLFLPCYTHAL